MVEGSCATTPAHAAVREMSPNAAHEAAAAARAKPAEGEVGEDAEDEEAGRVPGKALNPSHPSTDLGPAKPPRGLFRCLFMLERGLRCSSASTEASHCPRMMMIRMMT